MHAHHGCWENAQCNAVHYFEESDVSPVHIEFAGPSKDVEFLDVGEDDIQLLEYHSPPVMKEKLPEWSKQTHEEAQSDDG